MQYEANMPLAQARETEFAWPGGYPIYGIMDDGEYLCHTCLHEPEVHEGGEADGWKFEGSQIYWEGPIVQCAHCNKDIESAYGDPGNEEE